MHTSYGISVRSLLDRSTTVELVSNSARIDKIMEQKVTHKVKLNEYFRDYFYSTYQMKGKCFMPVWWHVTKTTGLMSVINVQNISIYTC